MAVKVNGAASNDGDFEVRDSPDGLLLTKDGYDEWYLDAEQHDDLIELLIWAKENLK